MGTVHNEFTVSPESVAMMRNLRERVECGVGVPASDGLDVLNPGRHLFLLQPHGGLIRSA